MLNSCITYSEVCDQRTVLVSLLKTTISQDYSTVKITALTAISRPTCYHIIHNEYPKILSEFKLSVLKHFERKIFLTCTSTLKQDNFNRFILKRNIDILNN